MPRMIAKSFEFGKKKETVEAVSFFGGAKRIRTAGLLVANEALYQLSHNPIAHSL